MKLKEATELFTALSPDTVMRLARGFLGLDEDKELTIKDYVSLGLINYLEGCMVCDDTQAVLALKAFDDFISGTAERLEQLDQNPEDTIGEPIILTMRDFRWFAAPGYKAYYDVQSAQWVKELPYVPPGMLVLDLVALWVRIREVIQLKGE